MKKLDCLHVNSSEELTQERIVDLQEDLLTILEAHSEDVDIALLFHHIIRYMTTALYECAPSHSEALKVLRLAMDDGIRDFMTKKKDG